MDTRKINYKINQESIEVTVNDDLETKTGNKTILSSKEDDITYSQKWYKKGYHSEKFLKDNEFKLLKDGLTECVKNIIKKEIGVGITKFSLENYHQFVRSDDDHLKVVSKTRDLFAKDFGFPILEIIPKFENILGFGLSDIDQEKNEKVHIIVRINRPQSGDYNPPHKDIYERVDNDGHIPLFVNFWVPIAGVNEKSSLPLAPSSHLIPENEIKRTFKGAEVGGNKYRVRLIEKWQGKSDLDRAEVNYGQVLIFSSHLIHGLAINKQEDKTRVSLEFRLFKK